MSLFPENIDGPPPVRPSRSQFLAFLAFIFLAMNMLQHAGLHRPRWLHGMGAVSAQRPPRSGAHFALSPGAATPRLAVHGAPGPGHLINLGRPPSSPVQALAAALFGGHDLILPSCLNALPPDAGNTTFDAALPVRDDLPGFYGAPWTAHVGGDYVALLHVYAPRNAALPVDAPTLQIYRAYDGHQSVPSFVGTAPAAVYRGSGAVLYRAFSGGPLRCLDLVVPKDESQGTAYLYYQSHHHYFERTARFAIQK